MTVVRDTLYSDSDTNQCRTPARGDGVHRLPEAATAESRLPEAVSQKQGDALELIDQLEKRVRELKDRKRKLNEAFVFNDTKRVLTQADYVQMRDDLKEQLAVVELERDRARMDEIRCRPCHRVRREPTLGYEYSLATVFS